MTAENVVKKILKAFVQRYLWPTTTSHTVTTNEGRNDRAEGNVSDKKTKE